MEPENNPGPSWGAMVVLLLLAAVVAAGLAWWLVYPFFHRR